MSAVRPPGPAAAAGDPAAGTSWPGVLAERGFRLLEADYRRATGPVAVAVLLAATTFFAHPPALGNVMGLAIVLALCATLPLAVIRKFPGPAITLILASNAVFVMFARLSWPPAVLLAWLIALAACPVMLSRRRAVLALALTEVAVLLGPLRLGRVSTPWDAASAEALAVVAAFGVGEMVRARRESALASAAAADEVRYLSERNAAARERAAIARELHDVVAHHVSMIAVRAATAPYSVADVPPGGREAFADIAAEARTALAELRVVLGVLRAHERPTGTVPQPRIADLDDLLRRMTSAGTPVTLTVAGRRRPLPGSAELCCYRIVQEALTNAGRHAPGSAVLVELRYLRAALGVLVSNTRPAAPAGHGLAGQVPAAAVPSGAAGYGLTGLRERVALLGGQFDAGPDGDGGFCVRALLPLAPLMDDDDGPGQAGDSGTGAGGGAGHTAGDLPVPAAGDGDAARQAAARSAGAGPA